MPEPTMHIDALTGRILSVLWMHGELRAVWEQDLDAEQRRIVRQKISSLIREAINLPEEGNTE